MSGRSLLVASAVQQAALRELAGSAVRGEASEIATRFARDRARAVLLTLSGWAAPEIAEAFGVGEDSVRRWRTWFAHGGIDALRATLAPGPVAERGERALACARELLAAPVQDRPNWTLPRLRARANRRGDFAEIEARTGVRLSQSHLGVLPRQKGASAGAGPGTP